MTGTGHDIAILLVAAVCTLITRALPFALFGRNRELPPVVRVLGNALPAAVIAILVIYCLKGVNFAAPGGWLPQLIGVAVVVGLHLWKRNNLLSIGVGTVVYMLLVQLVFA